MSFKLTIGKIARLGVPAFHNEAIISIRPHLAELDAYLFKVLPQFARQGDTKGAIKGATLNRDSISNILIPLPPLAEQHRIVAKVDELMALCDRLEAARAERRAARPAGGGEPERLNNGPMPRHSASTPPFALAHLAPSPPGPTRSSNSAKPSSTSPSAADSSPQTPTTSRVGTTQAHRGREGAIGRRRIDSAPKGNYWRSKAYVSTTDQLADDSFWERVQPCHQWVTWVGRVLRGQRTEIHPRTKH